ncbi:hypothetical protein D3C74_98200 [compost metagenome]
MRRGIDLEANEINPRIKRTEKNSRGKNVTTILTKAHTLYRHHVDVMDRDVALEVFRDDEEVTNTALRILSTNDPLKVIFPMKEYESELRRCREAASYLTNYLASIRRKNKNKNNAELQLKKQEYAEKLSILTKKTLAEELIDHISDKRLKALLKRADKKIERKAQKLTKNSPLVYDREDAE